jgi:hypothetical protein
LVPGGGGPINPQSQFLPNPRREKDSDQIKQLGLVPDCSCWDGHVSRQWQPTYIPDRHCRPLLSLSATPNRSFNTQTGHRKHSKSSPASVVLELSAAIRCVAHQSRRPRPRGGPDQPAESSGYYCENWLGHGRMRSACFVWAHLPACSRRPCSHPGDRAHRGRRRRSSCPRVMSNSRDHPWNLTWWGYGHGRHQLQTLGAESPRRNAWTVRRLNWLPPFRYSEMRN